MPQFTDALPELVINQQRLTELLEDLGDEVVQRLFIIYQKEMGEKIKLISCHLDQEEFTAVECESHALKSASTNLGLDQLGQVLGEIEQAAMTRDHRAARLSLHQAVKYCARVINLDCLGQIDAPVAHFPIDC